MTAIIEQTLQYIDEHLEDDITIEQLANNANYSVYYFQRMFSVVTGLGVKSYIRQRKLTKAAFDLIISSEKIIDIAMKYGFSTSESFTKSFKNQHGISPSDFRYENHPMIATPPLIIFDGKKEKTLSVKIIEIEETLFIGHKHRVSLNENKNLVIIPKLWDDLNKRKEDEVLFNLNDGETKGIVGICHKQNNDEIDYWIAVNSNNKYEDYESFILPASRYAVFEVIGPLPEAIQKGWSEIMTVWMSTSGYEIDEKIDLELYTDEDPSSEDLKSEIWIKLKT